MNSRHLYKVPGAWITSECHHGTVLIAHVPTSQTAPQPHDTYSCLECSATVFTSPCYCSAIPAPRPKIVCLCGSTRFMEAFQQAYIGETIKGNIVLTIGLGAYDSLIDPIERKQMLDELHLRKIELADEILVLNVGGYVGESTSREITHAKREGKQIRWLEAIPPTTATFAPEMVTRIIPNPQV